MEGGEDVASRGLMFRVRRVEEGETCGVQERRGRFRPVAPIGRRFREGGFDLRLPTLGGVEGDLEGYQSWRVEDVLV